MNLGREQYRTGIVPVLSLPNFSAGTKDAWAEEVLVETRLIRLTLKQKSQFRVAHVAPMSLLSQPLQLPDLAKLRPDSEQTFQCLRIYGADILASEWPRAMPGLSG